MEFREINLIQRTAIESHRMKQAKLEFSKIQ